MLQVFILVVHQCSYKTIKGMDHYLSSLSNKDEEHVRETQNCSQTTIQEQLEVQQDAKPTISSHEHPVVRQSHNGETNIRQSLGRKTNRQSHDEQATVKDQVDVEQDVKPRTNIFDHNVKPSIAIEKDVKPKTNIFDKDVISRTNTIKKYVKPRTSIFKQDVKPRTNIIEHDIKPRNNIFEPDVKQRTNIYEHDIKPITNIFEPDVKQRTIFEQDVKQRTNIFKQDVKQRTNIFEQDVKQRTNIFEQDVKPRTSTMTHSQASNMYPGPDGDAKVKKGKVIPEVKATSEVKAASDIKVTSGVQATSSVNVNSGVKTTSNMKVTAEVKPLSEVKEQTDTHKPYEPRVNTDNKAAQNDDFDVKYFRYEDKYWSVIDMEAMEQEEVDNPYIHKKNKTRAEKLFKCDACEMTFTHKLHPPREWKCDRKDGSKRCIACGNKCNKYKLHLHKNSETEIEFPNHCIYCSQQFCGMVCFVKHIDLEVDLKRFEFKPENETEKTMEQLCSMRNGSTMPVYQCNMCRKLMGFDFYLKWHLKEINNKRRYHCLTCYKNFCTSYCEISHKCEFISIRPSLECEEVKKMCAYRLQANNWQYGSYADFIKRYTKPV